MTRGRAARVLSSGSGSSQGMCVCICVSARLSVCARGFRALEAVRFVYLRWPRPAVWLANDTRWR